MPPLRVHISLGTLPITVSSESNSGQAMQEQKVRQLEAEAADGSWMLVGDWVAAQVDTTCPLNLGVSIRGRNWWRLWIGLGGGAG